VILKDSAYDVQPATFLREWKRSEHRQKIIRDKNNQNILALEKKSTHGD
jgi:hypothetical protein